MNILISSILFPAEQFTELFRLLSEFKSIDIGVEIFPYWHLTHYENILKDNLSRLKDIKTAFHSQYLFTDTAYPKGTPEYNVSIKYFQKTFKYGQILNSEYVVFHHYNLKFSPEEKGAKFNISAKNFKVINKMAQSYGQSLVIENTDISKNEGSNYFNEKSFILMALDNKKNNILIDIGHINCAGWNLTNIINELSTKIIAYHLHNNDGLKDTHNRILDGTLDFDQFIYLYKKLTPEADLVIEYPPEFSSDLSAVANDIELINKKLS